MTLMLEATANSGPMLRWTMQMLQSEKDSILLTRANAMDHHHKLLLSVKRVFDTFQLQLSQYSFNAELRPVTESAKVAYAKVSHAWTIA